MLTIICPITSRGCSPHVEEQPIFKALLPSMDALQMWGGCRLVLGYDSDDPVWSIEGNRNHVHPDVEWYKIYDCRGKITTIWNKLERAVRPWDYLLPANDDLAFIDSPLPMVGVLDTQHGFGLLAMSDTAFPGWPTFYVLGRLHQQIFDLLYPLPWEGAHQDPWIADVYRPWHASRIVSDVRVHNRIGISAPRFEYGWPDGYREAVLAGRYRVNAWLRGHDIGKAFQPDPPYNVLLHAEMYRGCTG